jgi:hypothetical protein
MSSFHFPEFKDETLLHPWLTRDSILRVLSKLEPFNVWGSSITRDQLFTQTNKPDACPTYLIDTLVLDFLMEMIKSHPGYKSIEAYYTTPEMWTSILSTLHGVPQVPVRMGFSGPTSPDIWACDLKFYIADVLFETPPVAMRISVRSLLYHLSDLVKSMVYRCKVDMNINPILQKEQKDPCSGSELMYRFSTGDVEMSPLDDEREYQKILKGSETYYQSLKPHEKDNCLFFRFKFELIFKHDGLMIQIYVYKQLAKDVSELNTWVSSLTPSKNN